MPGKLQGKVAVITGGNSGIGLATAQLFKAEGARVVVTASSAASAAKAQTELGKDVEVVQVDVRDLAQIDKLYAAVKAKHGGIDVLFANAGIAEFRPATAVDAPFFDNIFNVNVKGLYFTVQKALPLLREGSSVILNASVVTSKGLPGASVYSATKAAVRSFARSWTAEYHPDKIRFNVLSPGVTTTPILERTVGEAQAKAAEAQLASGAPIKRAATSLEIAKAALFLASREDSSFVVGFDLVADGGFGQV